MQNSAVRFGDTTVAPGERKTISLPLAAMYTHNDVQMTAHVINGRRPGPCLFVCAALHGDEISGVEIIRRLLRQKQLNRLHGTLVAIPIVNVYGFLNHTRYLPDGRDLNRSFPGSSKGSLAARIAYQFINDVIKKCSYGIDLHTGARHRGNLPQVRVDLSYEKVKQLAMSFGVPTIVNSKLVEGSLRQACRQLDIPVLVYEAGEALRFEEWPIRAGVRGILNVMRELGMLPRPTKKRAERKPVIAMDTSWVRAPHSGILRSHVPLGARADKGTVLGYIADPLGESEYAVIAPASGIVIGSTNLPLVHEGNALFHLAFFTQQMDSVVNHIEEFQEQLHPEFADDSLLNQ